MTSWRDFGWEVFLGKAFVFLFSVCFLLFYIDFFWDIGNYKTLFYFGVGFALFSLLSSENREVFFDIKKPEIWVLTAAVFALLISLVLSSDFYARKNYIQHIAYFGAVLVVLGYWLRLNGPDIPRTQFFIIACLFGLGVALQLSGLFYVDYKKSYFWNPHYLAQFCLLSLVVFSLFFVGVKSWLSRFFFIMAILVSFYILIETQSRPAWLSLFVVSGGMIGLHARGYKLAAGFFLVVLVVSLLYWLFPVTFGDRLNQLLFNILEEERVFIWRDSLAVFSDMSFREWFFGFGPGSSQSIIPEYMDAEFSKIEFPHNFIIEIMIESGLFGLVLWSVIFVGAFYYIGRAAELRGKYRPYLLILFWGLAVQLGFTSIIIPFYSKQVLLVLAPFLAIGFYLANLEFSGDAQK